MNSAKCCKCEWEWDSLGTLPFCCPECGYTVIVTTVSREKEKEDYKDYKEEPTEEGPMDTQVGGGHYKWCKIQPIEYCQMNELNYIESNVVKYVTRHRRKHGKEDILKAIHNLEILLEMEYSDEL